MRKNLRGGWPDEQIDESLLRKEAQKQEEKTKEESNPNE